MSYPHPIIAREGWPFVAGSLIAAVVVHAWLGFWWALLLWLIALFMVQFFRDPPRTAPPDPNAVLSPADGRVVVVERAHDPYLEREALKFSVFMNVFNAHSNRSPVDGEVVKTWYHAGTFSQRVARQILARKRACGVVDTHATRRGCDGRAGRRTDSTSYPLLCQSRPAPRPW